MIASQAFVTACLETAAANRKELEKAIASTGPIRVPIRTLTEPFPTKIGVLGFEETVKNGKRIVSDKPKEYSLDFVAKVVPSESVSRPFAYLIPPRYQHAIETLQRHGIQSRNCARTSTSTLRRSQSRRWMLTKGVSETLHYH